MNVQHRAAARETAGVHELEPRPIGQWQLTAPLPRRVLRPAERSRQEREVAAPAVVAAVVAVLAAAAAAAAVQVVIVVVVVAAVAMIVMVVGMYPW